MGHSYAQHSRKGTLEFHRCRHLNSSGQTWSLGQECCRAHTGLSRRAARKVLQPTASLLEARICLCMLLGALCRQKVQGTWSHLPESHLLHIALEALILRWSQGSARFLEERIIRTNAVCLKINEDKVKHRQDSSSKMCAKSHQTQSACFFRFAGLKIKFRTKHVLGK